ncbi:MAG TPA: peptidylprolyl isomerase [Egicoccus sp.]|nr:peptidylprolyl isomerase [Egicoccus sp.]HSK24529.1 peptidylprolyl isomerase [Egicoccus sp.]
MRIRSLSSVAVLAALLVGCGGAGSTGGGTAATVEGHEISRDRLEDAVRELTGDTSGMQAEQRNATIESTQHQVLSFLIQAQIILDVAQERGITVEDGAADERFQQDLQTFGDEAGLAEALASQQNGLTLELYRDVLIPASLHMDALREELAGEIESEEIETRTVRHILVETEPEAEAIVAELADGADFATLAQERSTDPGSGAQGGDLGPAPRGSYVPEFEDAVWDAEVGEVVGPVESQFGFHVLEVTETGTQQQAVGGGNLEQAAQMQVEQLLSAAFAEADVTVGAGLGAWDPELQRVVASDRVGRGAPAQPLAPGTDPLEESGDAPAEE